MAIDTPKTYRNLVIYQVYVRNHGIRGTFAEVEHDLERIRSMGVDILYLMPIHPIGKVARKGTLGSPYSISDYTAVNPEYGTKEDFQRLLEKAHTLGLKVMIDVVYNHTAHDSNLVKEHPEWFHQDSNGLPFTTVTEWSDVIDLKYSDPGLSQYLIEVLQNWVRSGVDGFRCDVASLVPIEFWREAREKVSKVKPGIIWMAESVHAGFVSARRAKGLSAVSDSELYSAFDLTYDYDIWPVFQSAVREKIPVSQYIDMLRFQDCIYPENYVKMRCVENHDQYRIQRLALREDSAIAWTAFLAFNKGPFFIYAGQESAATHTPSLFEKEPVKWGSYSLQHQITTLAFLKKHPAMMDGQLLFLSAQPAVQATWYSSGTSLYGVFNLCGSTGKIKAYIPDGKYVNLITKQPVEVNKGQLILPKDTLIFEYPSGEKPVEMESVLLG